MTEQKITNEMLYELLKEFKGDMQAFKEEVREFKHDVNQRFVEQNKRHDRHDEAQKEIKNDQREDRKLLMDIWESRKEVEYKITKDFIFKNLAWNAMVIIIGLALGKIFLL